MRSDCSWVVKQNGGGQKIEMVWDFTFLDDYVNVVVGQRINVYVQHETSSKPPPSHPKAVKKTLKIQIKTKNVYPLPKILAAVKRIPKSRYLKSWKLVINSTRKMRKILSMV